MSVLCQNYWRLNIQNSLVSAGVSKRAAAVYVASLQLGQATMTDIAKAANQKRSTTYLLVDELLMRGFMSSAKKGKKMYYMPEHPQRILQTLRNREREFEKLMPDLEALYYNPSDKPRIRVYEGLEAMMGVYNEMYMHIQDKGEALFLTAIGDLMDNIPNAIHGFFDLIRESNAAYRIRELNMGDERCKKYMKETASFRGKNHLVRSLDPIKFPFFNTDTLIFENKVCIFSFKKDIFTIVIENRQIADTYRALFNAAWEVGEEPA